MATPKKLTLSEKVSDVQYIFLGVALAALIVYYNREMFKESLGVSYPYFTMAVTMLMLLMFILSGWQFVRIVRKLTIFSKKLSLEENKEEDE